MIEPVSTVVLVNSALAFLAQHTPWLADKVGGAALSQAVREAWDAIKQKLGSTPAGKEALGGLESGPSPTVEPLRAPLLAAVESDGDFAARLSRLVVTGSENQFAVGNNIKQAKVTGSDNVRINIG